ncbi:MAG: hypothetical protein HLUCCO18_18590 [Rhodobacteraceae bacterium HLUCCO18]|nr:MAG: hypothetical protein HLUCCO18_18590 [Rhodobacteraceae bacterium HLUCCO18]
MRKTQGQGHSLADRIVLRTERSGHPRPAAPVSQTLPPSRELRKVAASATPRKGVTMDYQMGFASGSSN